MIPQMDLNDSEVPQNNMSKYTMLIKKNMFSDNTISVETTLVFLKQGCIPVRGSF